MRNLFHLSRTLLLILAGAHLAPPIQAHLHINAGANSTDQFAKLTFDDYEAYVASSGYVFELTLRPPLHSYAGFYAHDQLTFTALAATPFYGGPEPLHAAIGTSLSLQIVSVSGPSGGSFGFWEASDSMSAAPTVSIPTGSIEPTPGSGLYSFNLTEAFPDDPFGHIHDRAYSANIPGSYDVAFRIVDTTGWHTQSDIYTFRFFAVPEPAMATLVLCALVVCFLANVKIRQGRSG